MIAHLKISVEAYHTLPKTLGPGKLTRTVNRVEYDRVYTASGKLPLCKRMAVFRCQSYLIASGFEPETLGERVVRPFSPLLNDIRLRFVNAFYLFFDFLSVYFLGKSIRLFGQPLLYMRNDDEIGFFLRRRGYV